MNKYKEIDFRLGNIESAVKELGRNDEYRTIRDMRFELRMSGIDNIQNFNDIQVVELFNLTFATDKKYIGIDIDGMNINYYL